MTAATSTDGDGGTRRQQIVYGAGALLVVLGGWFVITDVTGFVEPSFLPSPIDVVGRFAEMIRDPYSGSTLAGHILRSLQRWGAGLAAAVVIGVPLGIVLAWVPALRAAVTPPFELLRYIPPFAWIPIAVLWFGASLKAQGAIVFVAAFPVCVINSQLGVVQVDPILTKAARSLGAGQLRTLVRVVLPNAVPLILTGVRTAVSNGWMALVGAELVVGREGLGFLIAQGQVNNSTPTIVVGMISIGVIGACFDLGLQRLQRTMLPWQVRP